MEDEGLERFYIMCRYYRMGFVNPGLYKSLCEKRGLKSFHHIKYMVDTIRVVLVEVEDEYIMEL